MDPEVLAAAQSSQVRVGGRLPVQPLPSPPLRRGLHHHRCQTNIYQAKDSLEPTLICIFNKSFINSSILTIS